MEIVEIIPPYLYSVKYDDEQLDEYHRMFRDWHEVGYLAEFFRLNADYLHTALERHLNQLAENADNGETPDFESYFHPLDGKYVYEWRLIPMKGYGMGKPTFIRLYAIRLETNCFLLVYGGLKLADTIQNSPVLNKEVFKRIDQTLAYMKREGITEQEDL